MNVGGKKMKLIECIGKRIDNLLKERGLTQYELSEKGGIQGRQ